jgi:hypothetical protein
MAAGGHFFGTVPDGKEVLKLLNRQVLYESPLLRVAARTFRTNPQCFGSAFSCSIGDTVTQARAPVIVETNRI